MCVGKPCRAPTSHGCFDSCGLHSVFERIHEFLCKFGRIDHEAEVSAGQMDEIESQLPRQHLVRLVCQLVLGVTSPGEHELPGMRSERIEIKLNSWILAQLVLHPVREVSHGV